MAGVAEAAMGGQGRGMPGESGEARGHSERPGEDGEARGGRGMLRNAWGGRVGGQGAHTIPTISSGEGL